MDWQVWRQVLRSDSITISIMEACYGRLLNAHRISHELQKLIYVQPTELNVGNNTQLTPNRSPKSEPFSNCDHAHRHKPLYTVNCGESIGITSKFMLVQPFIDRSSYQYWFWRGFIAFLVTPDHHFAQAVLYHMALICPGRFLFPTRTMVAAVSSQAHIQTASFACSVAGITNKE